MALMPSINAESHDEPEKPVLKNNALANMLKKQIVNQVENTKKEISEIEQIQKKVEEKEHTEFEEDFHAMTVLCYLKSNKEKLKLTSTVLAHNCFNSLMLILW